ncbi:hypothetical protein EDD37DRAFT_402674 [Exophiala viscosa]|uniref:Uncharacterized protein n=1 Tax=Exophiala viscosa TaxID=2486360 RepID=A0AAN6DZ46_9EURO|nr:hypothetical protein EDD36DRAFT_168857 [Exophiala viscosa]KAI1624179.1 hypothetical protein EDD37DRAFT_402674 [Exophiala viscosa]
MPPSWRAGLVNAFPIPEDRLPSKKGLKKQILGNNENKPETTDEADETALLGEPFPFFQLPAEIRNKVYALVLFSSGGVNGRKKSRTSLLLANKLMHQEASYILYSSLSFRIFYIQDFTSTPLYQDLRLMYRSVVTKLEMVIGSSWTSPPKTWRVGKLLARRLGRSSAVQTLKIFVQADPSLPMYEKWRISLDFYTDFCGDLLRDVLATMPHLKFIELDGNPDIEVAGPLVSRLLAEAEAKGKTCTLAPTKAVATPGGLKMVFRG